MNPISMEKVKQRKKYLEKAVNETHVIFSNTNVAYNYDRLMEGEYSRPIVEELLLELPRNDSSDTAFRQVLEVFEKVCENDSNSYITHISNIICEGSLQKTRTGTQTKDYLKMKMARFKTKLHTKFKTNIANTASAVSDTIDSMQNNFKKNTSDIKANIDKTIPKTKKEEDLKEETIMKAYESILNEYNALFIYDRVIKNSDKFNSHFNFGETVNRYYNNPKQAVIEMCSMIDAFNGISQNSKYAISLENIMYEFAKLNIKVDSNMILETVTDYYLIHNNLTEATKKTMMNIIENSVVLNNKDKELSNMFKDIAKLDIKFDDTFYLLQEKPDMSKVASDDELVSKLLESHSNSNKAKIIFDKFKLENEKTVEKFKGMIARLYVQPADDIIKETPNILSWLRKFFVLGGGMAINPLVALVMIMIDHGVKIHMDRKQFAKYIDCYKKEIEKTDKNISNAKDEEKKRLIAYKTELEKGLKKLKDKEEDLYTDDENVSRLANSSDSSDDFDFDFNFDESFVNYTLSVMALSEISSKANCDITTTVIEGIDKADSECIWTISEVLSMYPNMVNSDKIVAECSSWLNKNNEYSSYNVSKRDSIIRMKNIVESSKPAIIENNKYLYGNVFRLINMIEAKDAVVDLVSVYSLNEMDIANTIKMAKERLKSTVKSLSDKEKQMSRNIDISADQVSKSAEKALMNENREAVIRGSLIPSASKIIKSAIVTGAAWAVNPAVAVIGVLGAVGMSKKLQSKERQLILDDIEIELNMCDRYLKIAEDNNDMKAQKQLLITKRSLERQRQRIKYKMTVYANQKVDTKKGDDYDD